MKVKYIIVFLIVALLVFGATACTRSKSQDAASVTEPTPTVTGETLPTTDDVMTQLEQFVTQTAMAAQGAGEQTPVEPTAGESGETGTEPTAQGVVPTEAPPQPSATPVPTEAPPPTAVPVPTATPGIPSTYKLRTGEHVYCISRRFNVNPNEVLRLNGLSSGSLIPAGMTLKIPQTGNQFPGKRALISHPTTYNVKSGDTIYSVACQFGDVEPLAIAYANSLSAPYKLAPGQTIHIP